jgi:hypothetical protein
VSAINQVGYIVLYGKSPCAPVLTNASAFAIANRAHIDIMHLDLSDEETALMASTDNVRP